MSMAIIGVAGTVIGAGATAYSTYSQNKAAKAASGANANGINLGSKPKAAEYKPVNFTKEQLRTVWGNQEALNNIIPLVARTNASIDTDTLKRAQKMIPNYEQNMRLEGMATNSLLNGNLPYDDVLDIVAKRGEAGNAMGIPGGSAPATLRDLGLSRLDAMKTGAGLMKGMVDIAETINPVGRRMLPQSMMLSPMDRIRAAMEQNQIIQQSDQNRNNIEAGVSPTEAANAQLALNGRLNGGGGGQDIGGYAQALQGLIGGLGQAYKGSGAGGGTMNTAGMKPAYLVPGQGASGYYMPNTSIKV